jgi:hypothetical protein
MDAQARQQPTANQRADNADSNIGDKTKPLSRLGRSSIQVIFMKIDNDPSQSEPTTHYFYKPVPVRCQRSWGVSDLG